MHLLIKAQKLQSEEMDGPEPTVGICTKNSKLTKCVKSMFKRKVSLRQTRWCKFYLSILIRTKVMKENVKSKE